MEKDLSHLKKLRANHYVHYDNDLFIRRKDTDLTQYTNVDDITLKRAPRNTLERYANQLLIKSERKEQAEDRRQARRYDRSYVERGDYSVMSLYSDYKQMIEAGHKDWADYQEERKKWRRCKYKFCINVYAINKDNFRKMPARRNDSRYCCDECRKAEDETKQNMRKYGSYLPVHEIEDEQADRVNDRERERTASHAEKELQDAYNKRHEFTVMFENDTEEQMFDNLREKA